jgi:cyclophilin family peptidyl-prolyl cis-trans isomerase
MALLDPPWPGHFSSVLTPFVPLPFRISGRLSRRRKIRCRPIVPAMYGAGFPARRLTLRSTMNRHPYLEALESRIAPATLLHPLPDLVPGPLSAGTVVDLGHMFDDDAAAGYRTRVEFLTNYDVDAETPGLQAGKIVLEMFDESAPLTVQNFLYYVQTAAATGDFDHTFFHRSIPGFVLQGGGFEVTNLSSHLPTGPYVHNEFSAARSNLEGTIAMAKTPDSPHTATSEFFINLADNSENLDAQNGGFTVFGRVVEGMDVVHAIASLPTVDLKSITQNGALESTPVQGGYTTTGGIVPTAAQLIEITDARILTPHDGMSDGLTFSTLVTTPEGNPSNLVTTKLVGDSLSLKYRAGASGIAKVAVTAKDSAGVIVGTDEFSVTIQPNLITRVEGDTLHSIVVPGDKGTAKVSIWNTAGGTAKGKVQVKFYLSLLDENFQEINTPDILIGQAAKSINLLPGRVASVIGKIQIPAQLIQGEFQNFRVLAEVTSPDGARHISEVGDYTDDNLSVDTPSYHEMRNWFGTFQSNGEIRKNVALKYGFNGGSVKVALTGGGLGALFLSENFELDLLTTDTNANSALLMKASPSIAPELQHVQLSIGGTPAPIGTVNLGNAIVYGSITAPGGLKSLTVGHLDAGFTNSAVVIGAFAPNPNQAATIRTGAVFNFNLHSTMPVKSLTVLDWQNTDELPESLTFTSLGSFTSKLDLEASVFVTGFNRLNSFTVAGTLGESIVEVNGDVGVVSLGAMRHSGFLVGTTVPEVTAGLNAFTQVHKISSFTVKGIAGQPYALTDSLIAASGIGTIHIRSVNPSSSTDSNFGILADTINRYQRANLTLTKLDAASTPDITGDYILQIL